MAIHMEHERKFLPALPIPFDYTQSPFVHIRQGYVDDRARTRLRRERSSIDNEVIYTITVKTGSGISRQEDETEIAEERFRELWKCTKWRLIKKRYFVRLPDGLTAEINVFENDLAGYVHIEVEFDSAEEAERFIPPEWFGKEVTFDKRHSNLSIARDGIPR